MKNTNKLEKKTETNQKEKHQTNQNEKHKQTRMKNTNKLE